MNKFSRFLKLTGRLIGAAEENFDFEHRLYNASTIIVALFIVVANVVNAWIGLNKVIIYLGWVGFFISLWLYHRSRIKGIFDNTSIRVFVLAAGAICSCLYFFNAGLTGPMLYILIMFIMIFEIISPLRLQLEVILIMGSVVLGLVVFEYYSPSYILPYANRFERFADNFATIFYTLLFVFLALKAFKVSFLKERQKVLAQNEMLVEQQRKLEEQTQALQESFELVTQRNQFIEALLHELSHRVKNNLQVIISLLSLQANQLSDPKAKEAIEDSKRRLISIQVLHQKLYRDNLQVDVDMPQYLKELVDTILFMGGDQEDSPKVSLNVKPIILSVDKALPMGLIINELLSNSMKHAFISSVGEKKISITLTEADPGKFELNFFDNGKWMASDKERKSFGLHLVSILSRQLGGKFSITYENGTEIKLVFSDKTV